MKLPLLLAAIPAPFLLLCLLPPPTALQDAPPVGYDDTPQLPGSSWRVHDKDRPRPPVVTPGEGTAAPSDALVLFDGSSLEAWSAEDGSAAEWRLIEGAMEVNGTGSIRTRAELGDVQLHLEWRTPPEGESSSQGRGNSGIFLMGHYEVQVLDSYENVTYADGQAAALYGQCPPEVNSCRRPGAWQSYDIVFRAPRFEGDQLREPALVTVFHNGVLVHHAEPFLGATTHRALPSYGPHPPRGPLVLQDHGNPVRFRNIWVRPLKPEKDLTPPRDGR